MTIPTLPLPESTMRSTVPVRITAWRGLDLMPTVREAAEWMGGIVVGDGAVAWSRATSLREAGPGELALIDSAKKTPEWAECKAAAAVVPLDFPEGDRPIIRVAEPLNAFLRILVKLRGDRARPTGIHPTAIVDPAAKLPADVSVGPYCIIGPNTVIDSGCTLHSGVTVGAYCRVGKGVTLFPGVVLYDDTVLGDRVTIHARSVIGADGFGYRMESGKYAKIPQLGNVIVGDDVEIGASATIDRGTIGPTRIGEGTKIDNLVMIAHNCRIGRHNILAAQVGIAGSSSTGDYVVLAGQVGIADHLHVGNQAVIGAQGGVTQNIPPKSRLSGTPTMPVGDYLRNAILQKSLPELFRRVAVLEKESAAPDEGA
jgi:UDP-3-O-[3-hydroxymyristoyl] glucosamine N-acyltransferase